MDEKKLIESLSPNERKIIPYLDDTLSNICKKTNLDKVSVNRALTYLENKKIIEIEKSSEKFVEIGLNGALYKTKGLPERRLLELLDEKRILPLQEAKKNSKLSDEEFKASIGVLKKKALIELKNGKIIINASQKEIAKKTPEELLIESLPKKFSELSEEQKYALENLKQRKSIVEILEKKKIKIRETPLGKKLKNIKINEKNLIETITPEILRKEQNWKKKKFRRYDVTSNVPKIYGGKTHFINQSIDYARKIWIEMGFTEMSGPIIQSSFWNFDALFTAQDHPVREMQDTFFIDKSIKDLPEKIIKKIKDAHEKGVDKSKGWGYNWDEEIARKLVLRTHTTALSAKTISKLKISDLPKKFFSIGKCFRNETVDWSHGFEFYQTEGIVIDKNANFRQLIGYLKEFYKKMGFDKIRIRPGYFPYTEPSLEIEAWHKEKQTWIELGGAGIFRPEVTIPLLGENIPILAWGQGFDRIIMDYFQIKDLRELYKNNLTQLRKIKYWMK